MPSAIPFDLRPIQASDYSALAEFCAAFPKETHPVAFWRQRFFFWWEENPSFSPDFPRGCVLLAGATIVGMFALIPSRIVYQTGERVAANMSCWRVLPEGRKYSMKMFMALMDFAAPYPLLNTTPTKEVEAILKRVPFVHFSRGVTAESLFIRSFKGTSWWSAIKNIVRMHHNWHPSPTPAQALLQPILHHGKQMLGFYKARRTRGELSSVITPDAEFDRLWQRTRQRYPFTNVRAAQDLLWFLQQNPKRHPIDLLVHRRQGELVAFGLFTVRSTHHWPDKESYYMLDVWSAPPDRENLMPLLCHASDEARKRGIPVLRMPHYHPVLAALLQEMAISREIPAMTGYYFPPKSGQPIADNGFYCSQNVGDWGL
ncbi:MAG: hypothetical protein HQL78_08080 [Magnetococcales bacterium]|nr:hypothetical protein [Magnetococcales bacterium]